MNAEIHNLRLAWSWAVEQGSVERLGQMAGSLGMYCWEHSLHREGEPAFRAAAERVSAVVARPSPPAPDRLRTRSAAGLAGQLELQPGVSGCCRPPVREE